MEMLSVYYAKVKVMLNRCKVEMLSLGYGNIKTRLRQNCSLARPRAPETVYAIRPGFTRI